MDDNDILRVAEKAAREAAAFIRSVRESGELQLSYKGERDLLTAADIGAERIILSTVREHFPSHEIISEESHPGQKSSEDYAKPLWVIDPVDGTTNFAQGLPHVGVSIGFLDKGVSRVGVVGAPFLGETYSAVIGKGAYCGERRIQVSKKSNLAQALIGTGFPYARNALSSIIRRIEAVLKQCQDVRRLGAASLDICMVASGRLDAYYETIQPWDMAGGYVIAKEAGAVTGNLFDSVVDPNLQILPPGLCGQGFLVAGPELYENLRMLLQ